MGERIFNMAVHYLTQGFILKKDNLREADQVFTVFTKDFGKLKIIGKAIRKIKSKLRSGADLFYLSEIEFIQGKTHKILTDAFVVNKFKNIKEDQEKLEIAYQIAEAADNLIKGSEKDEKIFNLLDEVFNKLNNCSLFLVHCSLIYYYFLWNLLSILGYQIDLYHCHICQKRLKPEKFYFNPGEGIICSTCYKEEGAEVSPGVIKILRLFLKKDWDILSKLKIGGELNKSLEEVSRIYLSYYQQEDNLVK